MRLNLVAIACDAVLQQLQAVMARITACHYASRALETGKYSDEIY